MKGGIEGGRGVAVLISARKRVRTTNAMPRGRPGAQEAPGGTPPSGGIARVVGRVRRTLRIVGTASPRCPAAVDCCCSKVLLNLLLDCCSVAAQCCSVRTPRRSHGCSIRPSRDFNADPMARGPQKSTSAPTSVTTSEPTSGVHLEKRGGVPPIGREGRRRGPDEGTSVNDRPRDRVRRRGARPASARPRSENA